MYDIIQYGNEAFILFTFPLLGLVLERRLSKKQLYWSLIIAFAFITPAFASYRYVVPYVLRLLVLTAFSAAFGLLLVTEEERKYKVRTAWITSTVLFFLLGFFALMDTVAGYQEVVKTWYVNNYRVEYIKDQGFAGGPLLKYELSKYGFIPLFIKKVDVAVDRDSTDECLVKFSDTKMVFDKCKTTLTGSAR